MKLKLTKTAKRQKREPAPHRGRGARALRTDDLGDRRLRLLLATKTAPR